MTPIALFPVTNATNGLAFQSPADLAAELRAAVFKYYNRIADLRTARLADIWRLARDLVLAIEQGADAIGAMPGPRRMELAVDVAWGFIESYGGLAAVRDLVARGLDQVLPGFAASAIARWLVTERVARGLIRLVLEFAVREMKERID